MTVRTVIFINGRFLTQRVTGVQRYCRELLSALDNEISARPELKTFRWVLAAPKNSVAPELKCIDVEILEGGQGNYWEQISLFRRTRKDILISFGMTGPVLHGNQIITVHDASVHRVPDAFNWRFRLWYKCNIRWIVRRSRSVFCVSEFAKSECIRFFGARDESVHVCTEGWQHLDRIEESSEAELAKLVGEKPFVLAVSSPTPNKNFRLVVEAMKEIDGAPFEFVIAGSVDPSIFQGSRNVLQNAKYLGYVSDEQLKGLYRKAQCFVFPSRYEGFGIPPLEAMSMGCPVLASDIPSVREVCGDAATYFDPSDSKQLAQQLIAITKSPNSKDVWGPKGIARAKNFSWQKAANRVADHLMERYL